MADLAVSTSTIDGFFRRWEASGAAERANYSMFLNELCDLLDVPRPDPAGPDDERQGDIVICPHRVGGIGGHKQTAHLARKAFTIHNVPIAPLGTPRNSG